MSAVDDEVLAYLVRVSLQADERAYIVGAIRERRHEAISKGQFFSVHDFVRNALIEAAHR